MHDDRRRAITGRYPLAERGEVAGRSIEHFPVEPEIANAVLQIANLPLDTNVLFMAIMATKMPFIGRG